MFNIMQEETMKTRPGSLFVKGGRIIDPERGFDGTAADILIENGIITGIGSDLECPEGVKVLELNGEYVSPGFIDIHAHVFDVEGLLGGYRLGLPADMIGVTQGVTTLIDAGTAGPSTMDLFVKESVEKSRTRILSAMHYATDGLRNPPEADDPSKYDLQTGIDAYEKHRDIVVAIKARASNSCVGQLGIESIAAGKKLARAVGLPMLVHIGHMPPRIEEVADLLDKGDIITHAFHGKDNNLLDLENGTIPETTQRARDRGVLFDIGHGKDSFNINTGKLARSLGFYPDTISTDLHTSSFHKPVKSLPETMSKFMALGYTLEEVVDKVTEKPARYLSLKTLGRLEEGYCGDLTVFTVEEGEYVFTDANKNTVTGDRMIRPVYAVIAGSVEMDSQCEFRKLYRTLGADPDYEGETEYMAIASLEYLESRGVRMEGDRLAPFLNHIIAMSGRLRADEHLPGMEDLMDQMDGGALEITNGMMELFERWYPSPDEAERVLVAIHVQTALGIGV